VRQTGNARVIEWHKLCQRVRENPAKARHFTGMIVGPGIAQGRVMKCVIPCLTLVILSFGCATGTRDNGADEPGATQRYPITLSRLDSCDDLNTRVRENARAAMNKQLDDAIAELEAGTYNCMNYPSVGYTTGVANTATVGASSVSATPSRPSSVSTTNNQVANVDEADIVKTDGQFIYLVQGSELRIVQAWPAENAQLVSRYEFTGTPKKLFIQGNRALVYVSVPRSSSANSETGWMRTQASDCTYGYDCDFSGDGTATELVIFDITDRTAPKIVRQIDFPGSLIAARRIGDTVHTVVSVAELGIPQLETYTNYRCAALSAEGLTIEVAGIEAMRARNNATIDSSAFDVGVLATESGAPLSRLDCSDFYKENVGTSTGLTTVMSLDMVHDGAPKLANIVSRAGAVYASDSSLYISVRQTPKGFAWYEGVPSEESSTIHRFNIGTAPATTGYVGSGIVPGHVLNQFSMDENQGALRIATSKGWVPDPTVTSVLSVLENDGGALKVVGQVTGIGPGEDIRSVRFLGDRGYLVTFKKTDPLFVLDLANPQKPALVGELKIPGFSTYMHPLDETHLLSLGYAADDQGTFAWFNGIQMQIFDVTQPTNPTLLQKKIYGTRGSSSSALTDHLGFTFLSDRELLALPMDICDGGGNGVYGTLSFSGVVAMSVDVAKGFTELGRLEEPYATTYTEFQYGQPCADWWTDSSSVVHRTVVMDDYLYALSDNRIRIQRISALGTDVKLLDF
jgi:uncharacterized secreted protein with C-terminal beta-propeller domain